MDLMKKVLAVMLLVSCFSSVALAQPTGTSLLVKPTLMAYWIGIPDIVFEWVAYKALDYAYGEAQKPGAATSLGSAWWSDGYAVPTGGGGGGAW